MTGKQAHRKEQSIQRVQTIYDALGAARDKGYAVISVALGLTEGPPSKHYAARAGTHGLQDFSKHVASILDGDGAMLKLEGNIASTQRLLTEMINFLGGAIRNGFDAEAIERGKLTFAHNAEMLGDVGGLPLLRLEPELKKTMDDNTAMLGRLLAYFVENKTLETSPRESYSIAREFLEGWLQSVCLHHHSLSFNKSALEWLAGEVERVAHDAGERSMEAVSDRLRSHPEELSDLIDDAYYIAMEYDAMTYNLAACGGEDEQINFILKYLPEGKEIYARAKHTINKMDWAAKDLHAITAAVEEAIDSISYGRRQQGLKISFVESLRFIDKVLNSKDLDVRILLRGATVADSLSEYMRWLTLGRDYATVYHKASGNTLMSRLNNGIVVSYLSCMHDELMYYTGIIEDEFLPPMRSMVQALGKALYGEGDE